MKPAAPNTLIDRANIGDIDDLLMIYRLIYGRNYPHAFGTDEAAARKLVISRDSRWYVARNMATGRPVGSVVFDVDPVNKIGKAEGLAIHPEFRGRGFGNDLIRTGTDELLSEGGPVNSVFATTRTKSLGAQLICLRAGYLPHGIFPNAHKIDSYETLTLLVKHRKDSLDRRSPVAELPQECMDILRVIDEQYGIKTGCIPRTIEPLIGKEEPLRFEFIHAPNFVQSRFDEKFTDAYDRFFPFHKPNCLICSTNGEVEIYAYFSPQDRHCAIVGLNVPVYSLAGRLSGLMDKMKDFGIAYVELLLGCQYSRSIGAAIQAGFIPSAIYPAMRENEHGLLEDFIILSRTAEPLNFQGMAIDRSFAPFVNQYVNLWKKKALESLQVYDSEDSLKEAE